MTSENHGSLQQAAWHTLKSQHWATLFKNNLDREYLDRAVRNVLSDPVDSAVIRYCLAKQPNALPFHWLRVIRDEYALVCAEAALDEDWS